MHTWRKGMPMRCCAEKKKQALLLPVDRRLLTGLSVSRVLEVWTGPNPASIQWTVYFIDKRDTKFEELPSFTPRCGQQGRSIAGATAIGAADPHPALLVPPHPGRFGDQAAKSPASAFCGSGLCASSQVWRPRLSGRRSPSRLLAACAESAPVRSPSEWLRPETRW